MSNPRPSTRTAGSGTATPTATSGSQTITQTNAGPSIPFGTLRLRAEPQERRHIQWAEEVVDNEGMGKKSSKVCCIYHKPHDPGDSDDEDDSDSESGSDGDEEPDLSRAQPAGGRGKGKGHSHEGAGKGKGKERKASPNAYERQPKYKGKKEG